MSGLVLVLLWSVCPQALPLKGWAGRAESQFTCTQADVGLEPSLETPPCAHADLALPLDRPERLVEEAVVIGTRPMIQEGLRMKQPKGVQHLGPSPCMGRQPHRTFGLCGILTVAKERNPGGEEGSGEKCLSPCMCEWACVLLRTDLHLSLPHAYTQDLSCSGTTATSLWLLMVSLVISWGKRLISAQNTGLSMQWCFCLMGPNFTFGFGSVPCCLVASTWAWGSSPGAGLHPATDNTSTGYLLAKQPWSKWKLQFPLIREKQKLEGDGKKTLFPFLARKMWSGKKK